MVGWLWRGARLSQSSSSTIQYNTPADSCNGMRCDAMRWTLGGWDRPVHYNPHRPLAGAALEPTAAQRNAAHEQRVQGPRLTAEGGNCTSRFVPPAHWPPARPLSHAPNPGSIVNHPSPGPVISAPPAHPSRRHAASCLLALRPVSPHLFFSNRRRRLYSPLTRPTCFHAPFQITEPRQRPTICPSSSSHTPAAIRLYIQAKLRRAASETSLAFPRTILQGLSCICCGAYT